MSTSDPEENILGQQTKAAIEHAAKLYQRACAQSSRSEFLTEKPFKS